MKVLLIGGNGFLGKNLQKKFLEHNVDFFSPTKSEVNWITGKGIESLFNYDFDVVVHLLAIYGGLPFCLNNRIKMGLENMEINANVYRYIFEKNPSKIITIGSGCEYPGYKQGILNESDLGDGKLHQSVAHYGYTKLMQLQLCQAFFEELNIGYEHLVLANMYGPHDRFDLDNSHVVGGIIYKFFEAIKNNDEVKLMGTGVASRDLIYVEDVAEMILKLIFKEKSSNRPLNCSTGVGTDIKRLVELISNYLNYKKFIWGDSTQDGALCKVLNTEQVEGFLNWKPPTKIEDGIKKTLDWYSNDTKYKI